MHVAVAEVVTKDVDNIGPERTQFGRAADRDAREQAGEREGRDRPR
jgi:hypothetical protein